MLHINALIDRYVLLRHALFINTLISLTAIDTRIDMLLFNPPINLSILPIYLPACLPIYLSIYLSIYLPTYLPAYLSACLPIRPVHSICLFDLFIRSTYSTCLFNPPIQPTSYNKYSRRCYFSTYQSSIYPAFLSNLSIQ